MDCFENLSDDCIFLILEHVDDNSIPFLSLTCDILDFLISLTKREGNEDYLLSSVSRFKLGLEFGVVKMNMSTSFKLARGGHLEVLKYAHENGCRWDSSTCRNAAIRGHLEVLKYARKNGCLE